jgi:FkbM family methyltransferase
MLFWLYRQMRRTRLLRSKTGRRVFERAYLTYKLAEAGPIGRLKPYVIVGSCVVDVGANIGMFSDRFVAWTGEKGRVIALEPEAINYASLVRRLARPIAEKRVIALKAAAAEIDGQLGLHVNPDHPGDHKIGRSGIPVEGFALDTVLSRHGDPLVSLIKIDVQGAELRVLRGAAKTLSHWRPALFVEIDRAAMQQQDTDVAELVEYLESFGYGAYRLRRFGRPAPASRSGLGDKGYEDVLFLYDAQADDG